jgi:hypothetical protein
MVADSMTAAITVLDQRRLMADQGKADTGSAAGAKRSGKKRAGRPGLGGQGDNSVQIAFRVIPGVRNRAKEVADREGLTVSQLSRKALKQYLDKASPAK